MMSHPKLFLLVLMFLALDLSPGGTKADVQDSSLQLNDDVLGLIVFKSDLNNPTQLASWSEDDNSPCTWSFVRCDPTSGRVSELSLDGLGLAGKLGRGLEKLERLKVLSLSHNNLTGNFGPEIVQFPVGLETLNLSHNRFSGQIPSSMASISSSIKFLDLSGNLFHGPLSESFFESCSLHSLSIADNTVEGPLPRTLENCTSLSSLDLSSNRFSGNPFSSTGGMWRLNRLRILNLSSNTFSGPVPVGILALHNLKELHLQGNQFSGPIPLDIGLCPHLHLINLSQNQFTGAIPESLNLLNSLTHLYLSANSLAGDFPPWIGNMTSLEVLDLSSNALTGALPSSVGNLRSLQQLIQSNNKLSGIIPNSLVSCNQVSILRLSGNVFSGSIPEELFGMGLQQLDLSWNQLTGSVPRGSSKLFESLFALDLSGNKLKGDIPPEMGLFTNLGYLNLSWNNLHSRIPPELGYLQKLTVLDLRNTDLYGSVPGDLCDTGNLSVLQLDGNSLEGSIPREIGNCSSLYLLSLSHNKLSGPIPKTMGMLKNLEILRLEVNQLSGEIPSELGSLQNLLAANVSYNRLVGRLPTGGIFPSLDATSLMGNLGLCSPLLSGPCKLNVPKPLVLDPNQMAGGGSSSSSGSGRANGMMEAGSSSRFHHKRFLSLSAIIAMSAASVIVAGVVIISVLNARARRRELVIAAAGHHQDNMNGLESTYYSSSSRSGGIPAVDRLVLFDSKCQDQGLMTDPECLLSKSNEIGGGVLGTVYKASLNAGAVAGAGGCAVAIKKLVLTNIVQHPEDFEHEVRILGRVRHPNIVSLRGYYWTPQLQLLVSDYISCGNLQSKLHERSPSMPPLSWPARFKIMLGTAKGLAHLHHSCDPPIVHYNLKPSNILLDEKNNAKVSDFGLVRILGKKVDKHIISNRFQSALGYVAPEMACQSLRINEKCDVYGFGVMVLELVTGRRPLEYGEDNVVILSDHVRVLLEQENMVDCIDQSMGAYPEDEVLPALKLALVCTSQIPSSRPSMAEVVQILQVIKTPIPHRMEPF